MKAKAAKRKQEAEEEPDCSPVPKSRKTPASRITKATKNSSTILSGVSDYEEDPGRLESQEFLARTKSMSKKQAQKQQTAMAEVREKINAQQNNLFKLLQEKKAEIAADKVAFQAEFRALISAALLMGQSTGPKATVESRLLPVDTTPAANDYYTLGQSLQTRVNGLLKRQDDLTQSIHMADRDLTSSLRDTWENEGKEMERILGVGKYAAERQVNELLGRHSERDNRTSSLEATRIEDHEALKLWELGRETPNVTSSTQQGPGLLRALKYVRKGGQKMLKGVPLDDEEF